MGILSRHCNQMKGAAKSAAISAGRNNIPTNHHHRCRNSRGCGKLLSSQKRTLRPRSARYALVLIVRQNHIKRSHREVTRRNSTNQGSEPSVLARAAGTNGQTGRGGGLRASPSRFEEILHELVALTDWESGEALERCLRHNGGEIGWSARMQIESHLRSTVPRCAPCHPNSPVTADQVASGIGQWARSRHVRRMSSCTEFESTNSKP